MPRVPAFATLLGVTVVLSSGALVFVEEDLRRLLAVVTGLGILVAGVWFAANPFVRSSRCFLELRMELDIFVAMVRELHRQARSDAPPEAVERTRALMHKAVDRMVATARQARPGAPGDRQDRSSAKGDDSPAHRQPRRARVPPDDLPGGRVAAMARRASRLSEERAQLPRQ
jgi:hypothetical protein